MPEQPQLFFDKTLKSKKELKDLQAIIKDALDNSKQFREVNEEIKTLNAKRKKIVEAIKMDFGSEAGKIDVIKADLLNDKTLLSDASLNHILAGKTVEVEDSFGNKYEPEFSVKFRRV